MSGVHAEPPHSESYNSSIGVAATTSPCGLVESLRQSKKILFESVCAVIPGQAEKNFFQKHFRVFNERSYVSFSESKRYIVLSEGSCLVFADSTDPTPLYTIPIVNLHPKKEDSSHPHFHSHTVSPEANTGLPRANQSRDSLDTVLLTDNDDKIAFQITFDSLISGQDIVEKFLRSIELQKLQKAKK